MSAMADYEIWLDDNGLADSEASRNAYKASLGTVCGVCRIPLEPTETPGEYVHSGAEPGHAPVVSGRQS